MKLKNKTNVPVSESSQLLFFQFAGLYAINGQFPRVGRIQCPDNLQQGSLPRTAWTYNGNDFPWFYRKIDPL